MVDERMSMEPFFDRLKSFVKRTGRIFFQIKKEASYGINRTEIVRMFDSKGRALGHITYEIYGDLKILIHSFTVEDWNERTSYPQRLLNWFIKDVRRRGIMHIEGKLYGLSASGHETMLLLKSMGFEITEMGALSGRSEYYIKSRF